MITKHRHRCGRHAPGFNEADHVDKIMHSNDRLAGLVAAMMAIVIAVLIIERALR